RRVAVDLVAKTEGKGSTKTAVIGLKDLAHYLGVPEFVREKISVNSVGIATGLAWTENGGETLTIEVTSMPGQGKIILTGKLGSVMQESAQAAFSLVKSKAKLFHLRDTVFH